MKTEEMIVNMYSILTDVTDRSEIYQTLLQSRTFCEIQNGNEALLYEGYVSNLLDIAEDLNELGIPAAKLITPSAIKMVNRASKFEAERNITAPA